MKNKPFLNSYLLFVYQLFSLLSYLIVPPLSLSIRITIDDVGVVAGHWVLERNRARLLIKVILASVNGIAIVLTVMFVVFIFMVGHFIIFSLVCQHPLNFPFLPLSVMPIAFKLTNGISARESLSDPKRLP